MMEQTQRIQHERGHPGPGMYVFVALVLAVVTLVEVAIIYMPLTRAIILGLLFALSIGKFALVAMFFMHLRYDDRLFSVFFVGGMVLAVGVLTALLSLFSVAPSVLGSPTG